MEITLKVGDLAPAFEVPDQNGQVHRLEEYRGKWVLLYFYPKDDTTGCTAQACGIRDAFPEFGKSDLTVLGVSVDSVKSHKKFEEKYGLPFTLLADEQKEVVNAYGVWGLKKFMGREYEGTMRTSFLINPDGKIAAIFEKVKPAEHVSQVLAEFTRAR